MFTKAQQLGHAKYLYIKNQNKSVLESFSHFKEERLFEDFSKNIKNILFLPFLTIFLYENISVLRKEGIMIEFKRILVTFAFRPSNNEAICEFFFL